LCTLQLVSAPVSPKASVSKMHSVQVPVALPLRPETGRVVRLKLPAPVANVSVGNAATVTPLCASAARSTQP
jgi:hypothetical protein